MSYTIPQLLAMTSDQLDELFLASPVGDIPNGEAQGTAIIASDTKFSAEIAMMVEPLRMAGEELRRRHGDAEEPASHLSG